MLKKNVAILCISTMLLTSFVGCKSKEVKQTNNTEEPKKASTVLQAPELEKLVSEGKLPPLAERMPVATDVMVEKTDSLGDYGGDLRMVWKGKADQWTSGMITEEAMFRFKPDGSGVEPNVAKSVDINKDSTEFVIKLRKGMKWSDGVPFTADDVVFYYEHMVLKETFGKKVYDCYYSIDPVTGDKAVATVTKVDETTVKVTFKYPNPQFLERLAIDNKWFFAPKHYYEKILPEFIGEEAAKAKAKEMGYADVVSMNKETGYYYWNIVGRPTLRAWVASNDPNSELYVMTRNPYFWKTDSTGKQLPYINNLKFTRITDDSQALLKVIAGEADYGGASFTDFAMYKQNEAKGHYKIFTWQGTAWSSTALQLNQTVKDEKLRAVFADIRFREALSIAADRKEISEIVTDGLAKPAQSSVQKGLFGYSEAWANKWTKYDPEGAKKLLDQIGLKVGSDGFRTYSDGTTFVLTLQSIADSSSSGTAKLVELLTKYYEKVGIKVQSKQYDKALFSDMNYSNQLIAIVGPGIATVNVALRPDSLVPMRYIATWSGEYGKYYGSQGKEGIKPEGDIAKLNELWEKIKVCKTKEEIQPYVSEILKLHEKNLWEIGYTEGLPAVLYRNEKLMNIPESRIYCDEFRLGGFANLSQAYFKK